MSGITGADFKEETLTLYNGISGHLSTRKLETGGLYTTGTLYTDYGAVGVMMHQASDNDRRSYLILETSLNGSRMYRHWERAFSEKYVKTLAKRFMKDLHDRAERGEL